MDSFVLSDLGELVLKSISMEPVRGERLTVCKKNYVLDKHLLLARCNFCMSATISTMLSKYPSRANCQTGNFKHELYALVDKPRLKETFNCKFHSDVNFQGNL